MSSLAVSTIIPTYNRAGLIEKALLSALRESIPGDEVIVVDDGSSDNTIDVLRPYNDRIRYVRIERSGAGAARNEGIRLAKNPLIAFLDSDDEWVAGKMYLQRSIMEARPEVLFCFSDISSRMEDGRLLHNCLLIWHNDRRSWDSILGPGVSFSAITTLPPNVNDFKFYVGDIYAAELSASYISTCTVMVRRNEAGDALRFGVDVPLFEDWECFGRLAGKGKGAYLECETLVQNVHGGDRLTRADQEIVDSTRIKVIERVWGADTNFVKQNGQLYRRVLDEQRLQYAGTLLNKGKTGQAKSELRLIQNPPISYRILAHLPGPMAVFLLWFKRKVQSFFRIMRKW